MLIHLPSDSEACILFHFNLDGTSGHLHLRRLRGQETNLTDLMEPPPTLKELLRQLGQLPPLSALGLLSLPPFGAGVTCSGLAGSGKQAAMWNPRSGEWVTYSYTPSAYVEASLPAQLMAFYEPQLLPELSQSLIAAHRNSNRRCDLTRMARAATPLIWAATFSMPGLPAAALNAGIRALPVLLAAAEAARHSGKHTQTTADPLLTLPQWLCLRGAEDLGLNDSEAEWMWEESHRIARRVAGEPPPGSWDRPAPGEDWGALLDQARAGLNRLPSERHWSADIVALDLKAPALQAEPQRDEREQAQAALMGDFTQLLSNPKPVSLRYNAQHKLGLQSTLLNLLWEHQNHPQLDSRRFWRSLGLNRDSFHNSFTRNLNDTPRWTEISIRMTERRVQESEQRPIEQLGLLPEQIRQQRQNMAAAWAEATSGDVPERLAPRTRKTRP